MRFVERHAWKVFAGLSVLIILFAIGDMAQGGETFRESEAVLFRSFSGTTWDELSAVNPGAADVIDYQVRSAGVVLLMAGVLSLAVSVTALRRGDRWAWYAMWAWPLWMLLAYFLFWMTQPDLSTGIPVPLISASVLLAISVLTLGLSYRRYLRPA